LTRNLFGLFIVTITLLSPGILSTQLSLNAKSMAAKRISVARYLTTPNRIVPARRPRIGGEEPPRGIVGIDLGDGGSIGIKQVDGAGKLLRRLCVGFTARWCYETYPATEQGINQAMDSGQALGIVDLGFSQTIMLLDTIVIGCDAYIGDHLFCRPQLKRPVPEELKGGAH